MTTRQNTSETIREEGVNVQLAQLLRNRGISARVEQRSRKGLPDVPADLRSGDLATASGRGAVTLLVCNTQQLTVVLERYSQRTNGPV